MSQAMATLLGEYIGNAELFRDVADKATIWRWERTRGFPPPIKLSDRVAVRRRADVAAWIEAQGARQAELIEKRSKIGARLAEGKRAKRQAAEQRRRRAAEAQVA
jgi:hypothetical protein